MSELVVSDSNITALSGVSTAVSTVIGLAAQSGDLALENSSILFNIENPLDQFVGLVGEQLGQVQITNATLSAQITANTSAFGLFQITHEAVLLSDSAVNVSLATTVDGHAAVLAEIANDTFTVTNCELNATVFRGASAAGQDERSLIMCGNEHLSVSDSEIEDTQEDLCEPQDNQFASRVVLNLNVAKTTTLSEHAFFFPRTLNLNDTTIWIIGIRPVFAKDYETVFSLFEDRPLYRNVRISAEHSLSVSGFQRAAVLNAKTPTVLTIRNC